MTYETFMDEVGWRAGLAGSQPSEGAVRATLELVGQRLAADDARTLAAQLPGGLAALVASAPEHHPFGLSQLFVLVASRERVPLGAAVEHAKVVCEVLTECVDADTRALLHARLPPDWAALFRVRERGGDGHGHARGHTLADGRPGSAHPISEAEPPLAQDQSVVLADNPHADSKVSSAPGLRPGYRPRS
jgi:uncharacterized protein (DUF2267 family)